LSAISDRISQLSSQATVYTNVGVTDSQTQLDNAHGARLALDAMADLALFARRTSTGGQVTSTGQANTVALSTGAAQFGLASTRYQQSGCP